MREEAYRIFVTDSLNALGAKFGFEFTHRYADLVHVAPKVKDDTPEEIIARIRKKLG